MRLQSLSALTLVVGATACTGTAGALTLPPPVPGTVINTTVVWSAVPPPSLSAPVSVMTKAPTRAKPVVKKAVVKKAAVKKAQRKAHR